MYKYMYVCMYIYIYIYTHTQTYIYIYTNEGVRGRTLDKTCMLHEHTYTHLGYIHTYTHLVHVFEHVFAGILHPTCGTAVLFCAH